MGHTTVKLDSKTFEGNAKKGGILDRLFGRGAHAVAGPTLELADIQGFIVRGYRMPMVGIFCYLSPPRWRRVGCSDASLVGMSQMCRK
jgi:hypothetical protein